MRNFIILAVLAFPITVASFVIAIWVSFLLKDMGASDAVINGVGWTLFGYLLGTSSTIVVTR